MSFGAIAGAAIGLVGTAMASSAADDRADQAAGIQQAQLDFQRQQYEDWKEIYGPLQEDINTYWKNVNGREMVAKEVEAIQLAGQQANKQVTRELAQRGIQGSGLEADLVSRNILGTEMEKARIRNSADERKIAGQTGLLSLGLGQGSQISSQMANTSSNLASSVQNAGLVQSSIISQGADTLGGIVGYGFDQYQSPSSAPTMNPLLTYGSGEDALYR